MGESYRSPAGLWARGKTKGGPRCLPALRPHPVPSHSSQSGTDSPTRCLWAAPAALATRVIGSEGSNALRLRDRGLQGGVGRWFSLSTAGSGLPLGN